MLDDLRDLVPLNADRAKLVLWNAKWKEEHARARRAKDLSGTVTLPKRTKMAQYASSGQGQDTSGSGMQTMMQTLNNHLCSHVVGIPFSVIKPGKFIGSGAYGSCKEVTVEGNSFFPSNITYCAKMYKGANYAKLEGFQKEKGMQTMNASLVRCIAFTTMPPWVSISPLFNGKTIDRMLFFIPYRESSFRPAMEKLLRGSLGFRPSHDETPTSAELAHIKAFVENMPNIMHALIDGLKASHSQGIVHCGLHASSIVLDFTKDNIARIGIIDWGLMLIDGMVRPSTEYMLGADEESKVVLDERRRHGDTECRKRPWMAPKIYDPLCQNAYTKASDVYALGWLFSKMIEFWKVCQRHFFHTIPSEHPDYRRIWLIEDKVKLVRIETHKFLC